MSDKKKKPIWMPLYVAEFLADTASLTAAQVGAYINLLCAMWRSEDGTLEHDADTLARVGRVHRPRWARVWGAIKHLFDVDGDRVTSVPLQAELGKANALIASRRAAARIGGRTTQFRRTMNPPSLRTMTPSNPLKNNNGAQANAQHNYNHNRKEKEEGGALPLPCNSKSAAPQEASRVQPPECPISDEERAENMAKLDQVKRMLKGGSAK
jgi:uncharacterized protein YdaU (DUF1376 family)